MARYCQDWKPDDWPSEPRNSVYSLGVMVRSTSHAPVNCSKMRATLLSILKAGSSLSSRIALIVARISWMASFIHSSEVWCWMMKSNSSCAADNGCCASSTRSRCR